SAPSEASERRRDHARSPEGRAKRDQALQGNEQLSRVAQQVRKRHAVEKLREKWGARAEGQERQEKPKDRDTGAKPRRRRDKPDQSQQADDRSDVRRGKEALARVGGRTRLPEDPRELRGRRREVHCSPGREAVHTTPGLAEVGKDRERLDRREAEGERRDQEG